MNGSDFRNDVFVGVFFPWVFDRSLERGNQRTPKLDALARWWPPRLATRASAACTTSTMKLATFPPTTTF